MTSLAVEAGAVTGGDHESGRNVRETVDLVWHEMVKHWKLAGPIALMVLCNYFVYSITYIFVGHLGDLQLSAVAVSFSVIGTFTFGTLFGMASALETLCGQAYGAGEHRMLGIYMQRAWITLWLITCVLLVPIYIFAGPLLKLLGQDAQVAYLAGKFNVTVIPRMFAQATSFPTQKFLLAQRKVWPTALSGILGLAAHCGLMWVFVSRMGWGLHGVAIAYNASYCCVAVFQVVYVVFWCKDVWMGWSWEAFRDLWMFFRLSLASGVMLCLELWNSMSMVLLASHLHNAVIVVGSLTISLNINGYEMMLFIGMNTAASIRVANELGLRRPKAAKFAIYVAAAQSVVIALLAMALVMLLKNYLVAIFTNEKELRQTVSNEAWLLGLTMLLNVQIVLSGIVVGVGWQKLLACINFCCYYIFGHPLGIILCYAVHLGVKGLWAGMLSGLVLQSSIVLIMLYRTNWNQEVEETAYRLKSWGREDVSN